MGPHDNGGAWTVVAATGRRDSGGVVGQCLGVKGGGNGGIEARQGGSGATAVLWHGRAAQGEGSIGRTTTCYGTVAHLRARARG